MPHVDPTEINPSPIILSLALTISVFPAISVVVHDPVLQQRSSLRHLLIVYKGIILSGYLAFPLYFYLLERNYATSVYAFVVLFTAIGIGWAYVNHRLSPLVPYVLSKPPFCIFKQQVDDLSAWVRNEV